MVILNKTCRLCTRCELLVAHEADVATLIAGSGHGARQGRTEFVVLGTVEPRVWREGLAGRIVLGEVREHMADFKAYVRVDFTPGGWSPLDPTAG